MGTLIVWGLGALCAYWIVTGVRNARRRPPGEPPIHPDGGAFNQHRGR